MLGVIQSAVFRPADPLNNGSDKAVLQTRIHGTEPYRFCLPLADLPDKIGQEGFQFAE